MASVVTHRRVGNLPAELTSFVDSRHECADVRRLLSISRLVTLTGVGGVGKTRLALKAAALVELAEVRADDLVMHTVAETWASRTGHRAKWMLF